jgi:hypothetical protein
MENPKILLCSPINIAKEYCLYEWLEAVKRLSYPNLEVFLVDNSNNPAFSEKIRAMGFDCVHEPPNGRETREFIAASLERCRVKFLSGGYDYYFSLECDIFPPDDIIEKLLAHDLEVVGTTFWTEHKYFTRLQLQGNYIYRTDFVNKTKEYKVRDLTFEEGQLFIDGTVKPIYGAGLGCVLIRREIMEGIVFRVEKDEVGFPDSFFHKDIWKMGVCFYIDTSIIPKHLNSNWNTVLSDSLHKKLQAAKKDIKLK